MQKQWKVTKSHHDPFAACGKCSWDTMGGIPSSSEGGNDYACIECGMVWFQRKRGILTSSVGRIVIPPLFDTDDPFTV